MWLSKSIFFVKKHPNLSQFLFHWYQFRGIFLSLTLFENFNFQSTLFTKIMLIFWSIDLELMLIWQFFLWKIAPIWCGSCWKNLNCYLVLTLPRQQESSGVTNIYQCRTFYYHNISKLCRYMYLLFNSYQWINLIHKKCDASQAK